MSTSVYDLSKINPSEDFKIQEKFQFWKTLKIHIFDD